MVSPDPSLLGDIIASLPVAVYRTSPEGRFVAGNAALVQMLGAGSFAELAEVDVRSLYADPSQRDHLVRRVSGGEELPAEELKITRLDGAPIWVRVRSRGVLENDGSIAYFEGVMEDVSELRSADERLHRSNALLDTLTKMQNRYIAGVDVGDLFDGLLAELLAATDSEYGFIAQVLRDDDGAFLRSWAMTDISWNEATREMFAEHGPRGMEFHNLDTLFGRVVTGEGPIISNDPLHDPRTAGRPEGHPPLDSFLGVPIRKGDDVLGMVALANRPGGYDEWMIGYLEPLAATVGSLIEAVVAERELRAAEVREQDTEELYRSVIERATEAIVSFRDDGTIVAANHAAASLAGVDVADVVGSELRRFVPGDRLEQYLEQGEEAFRSGAPLEAAVLRADGSEHPVEMSFVRSEFGARPITTLIIRDIAERKAFERALLEARDVAERTARAKDEFLAGISHELRTPLNSVIGLSSILGKELHGPLTDKQSEYVAQIESSGRHLLAIISNILDLAKLEAEKLEADLTDVEVAGLVDEAASLMRELAVGKGVTLSIEVPPALPAVVADHLRAKQVLLNLLSNAVKFTEEGGKVGVRARQDGPAVSIAVWDTGEGIPADKLQTVFEAFVQVDSSLARKHEGTGLGLTLSRRLADMQNGHLSAESILGEGSVFTLTLPVASDAAS
jgi:PAS domain S-box-containing protein